MNKKIRKRYMRKKKILVTGGEGFIGKHLVNRLKEMGHDVITMNQTPGADYEMDICNIRDFEPVPYVDVIYHLAAPGVWSIVITS
jgi:nucleoside-diphosphate-sugar epimerase